MLIDVCRHNLPRFEGAPPGPRTAGLALMRLSFQRDLYLRDLRVITQVHKEGLLNSGGSQHVAE